jgi:hypothetical protein
MSAIASGFAAFGLLCASAGLGILVRPRLCEQHRARETQELMQITIGLLVTFAAGTVCRRSPAGGRCREFA